MALVRQLTTGQNLGTIYSYAGSQSGKLRGGKNLQGGHKYGSNILLKSKIMANNFFLCLIVR